jgi:hypothetical protein
VNGSPDYDNDETGIFGSHKRRCGVFTAASSSGRRVALKGWEGPIQCLRHVHIYRPYPKYLCQHVSNGGLHGLQFL